VKIKCPECKNDHIDFLKLWLCGPYISFKCPECNTTLIVKKIGRFFAKNSSYLLGIPGGIFLGIMIVARLFNRPYVIAISIIVFISTLIVDFLIDSYQYQIGKMIVEKKSSHGKEKK
jgi:hypothetical protein